MAGEEEELRVVELCFGTPAADTPRETIRLSPLDLMVVHGGYTPLVHFYRRRPIDEAAGDDEFFKVTRLKTALCKTLVPFYPLAGRFRATAHGKMEIDCNEKGMLFVVAHSCYTIDDFSDFKPSPKQRRLFIPHIHDSAGLLCATQVTFLKCGGVAIGTAPHHGAMDGSALSHFLQTWTAFAKDGDQAVVNLPCHDRTRLCARDPPVVHPDALSVFAPKIIKTLMSVDNKVEVFILHKDHISALKRMCGGGSVSTFSAVSAHVWQCMCLARQLPPESTTCLSLMTNARRRMTPPLPDGYFGNAVVNVSVADKSRGIASGDMAYIVRRIRDTINRVNDELVHSAIDYLELALTEKDNRHATGNLPVTDIRLGNWLGLPLYDLDFSWGKPLALLRAESNRGGCVHMLNSAQGDGSVHVIPCIEAGILKEFKRLLYAKFDCKVYSRF